jgi:hypothetical protein
MRIAFLLLASIGGCTPLVIEQRFADDPFTPTQTAFNRQLANPAPTVARVDGPAVLSPTTSPNGTAAAQMTAKQPMPVVQLPSQPVPIGSPTLSQPADPVAGVQQFINRNNGIQQTSFAQTKPDKPGGPAERTDPDAQTGPPSLVPPTNNVVDLGNAPLVQQPQFRMVNTKKFTLNFEIKDAGATGISTVDLWFTQDMRTWKKFDSVQQLANALVVEVKDEGTYGFTLVARNGNGVGKSPPQPGESPQVWVNVDTTPPAVTLAGVEMSLTSKTPSLIIRWTAKDRNFGPRPVTLSYAANADGPWTLLASNVENNGRYEWPLPKNNVPASMYVRVQAADLNGNVGSVQTEKPIRLDIYTAKAEPAPPATDALRPNATIVTVEPQQ